jgi:hypothetical protein
VTSPIRNPLLIFLCVCTVLLAPPAAASDAETARETGRTGGESRDGWGVTTSLSVVYAANTGVGGPDMPRDANATILRDRAFLTRPAEPDYAGLASDSKYFIGYQVMFLGVLYVMPQSISGWSKEQKDQDRVKAYKENVTDPVWDKDRGEVNYIGHPYFGATYYMRARQRGFDEDMSFWYSALMSTAYEFGVEALFEEPSIQDLIVTPVGGALLGKFWFEGVHGRLLDKVQSGQPLTKIDRTKLFFIDPIGVVNKYVRRWIGRDKQAMVTPIYRIAATNDSAIHDDILGVQLEIAF